MTEGLPDDDAIEALVLTMLTARAPNATVCPSEVARAVTPGGDWRVAMMSVHQAVDSLAGRGAIRLSWKGEAMPSRAGPYRIGRAAAD